MDSYVFLLRLIDDDEIPIIIDIIYPYNIDKLWILMSSYYG